MKRRILHVLIVLFALLIIPLGAQAAPKKGLLVYDSIYGSTVEVAYWIKAIIGTEQQLDVKSIPQVITLEPYDYIILGSATRNEGPTKTMHKFLEANRMVLAKKELCFFLVCGDSDETQVLKIPGKPAHLIAGRNYLQPIYQKYPELKYTCIAGLGGRQVMASLGMTDRLQIKLLEKLAKEGAIWLGRDIWESLVVERVEAFANEVRVKVLGLGPRENVEQFRGYWQSLQPANLKDPSLKKFKAKPWTEKVSSAKIYYSRSRIKGDLEPTIAMIQSWARDNGYELREQVKSFFNVYYHAVKKYDGKERVVHIVPSTMPEDPGTVHISFRNYDKPEERSAVVKDIEAAEKLLWANGRKLE
jgi:menaquinone-dependent protoporphyrinogen IX oxidase